MSANTAGRKKLETRCIRNYRERVRQCKQIEEYAMAEQIRGIPVNEQDYLVALATAPGREVPRMEPSKHHAA